MIIKVEPNTELRTKAKKMFTVENKDLIRKERMLKRPLPWLKRINLYSKDRAGNIYLPN